MTTQTLRHRRLWRRVVVAASLTIGVAGNYWFMVRL